MSGSGGSCRRPAWEDYAYEASRTGCADELHTSSARRARTAFSPLGHVSAGASAVTTAGDGATKTNEPGRYESLTCPSRPPRQRTA